MIRFLQKPGPVKKYVLGGILLVVSVTMVTYLIPGGISDYFGNGITTQGIVARVGDQDIGLQQVSQQARLIAKQQFKGQEVPPALMPYLMRNAAQGLIVQKAIVYEADRMGFGVTDEELRGYLRQGEIGQVLFPNGTFIGDQAYEQFIQSQFNMGVSQFQQEVKAEIAQRKLLTAVGAALTVSDKSITDELKKQDTKVKFDYAVLTLDDVKKQINPTEVELKAFYDQNKQLYANTLPAKVKARYILIDTSKLAENVQVTPAEVQQYYNQHQDDYRLPETVTVRHILVKAPAPDENGKVDQKAVDAANAKANDLAKQLKSGANFADLAKKNSDDPGSAKDGGLLPPITRGRTVPEFEQAAFNTPVGQTTAVIRTSYGFHIIRVEGKQQARLKPLDEVKVEIEPLLKKQKVAAQAQSVGVAVQATAAKDGLEKAAAAKNFTVTTTDFITQTDQIPGIGTAPDLMNALFAAKKNDPPALTSTPAGPIVYQVIEIQPAQTPGFEQIKAKVEDQFKSERAQALLAQKTRELADRAHADHDLNKAAKEVGAMVKTSDLVDRNSQVPDVGAMSGTASVAFGMKEGEISSPIQGGANGVVLKIVETQAPSAAQMKQDWDKLKEALLQQKREEYQNLYVENLRDRLEKEGKIKINKKEMDNLSKPPEGA